MTFTSSKAAKSWAKTQLAKGVSPRDLLKCMVQAGYQEALAQSIICGVTQNGLQRFAEKQANEGHSLEAVTAALIERGVAEEDALGIARAVVGRVEEAKITSGGDGRIRVVLGIIVGLFLLMTCSGFLLTGRTGVSVLNPLPYALVLLGIACGLYCFPRVLPRVQSAIAKHTWVLWTLAAMGSVAGLSLLYRRASFELKGYMETAFWIVCLILAGVWIAAKKSESDSTARARAALASVRAEEELERVKKEARTEFIEQYRQMREIEREIDEEE